MTRLTRYVLFCLLSAVMITFTTCKRAEPVNEAQEVILPDGFADFYKRFHRDSLYQMEHVLWSPGGRSANNPDPEFRWTKENWKMHHPPDMKGFRRDIEVVSDDFIIEMLRAKVGGYALERRFSKSEADGWQLIFYATYIVGE